MAERKITYAAAMEELESIVERMEAGQVEVDDLAASVRRASELIVLCRSRLRDAGAEVEKALSALRDEAPSAAPQPDAAIVSLPTSPRTRADLPASALPSDADEEDPFADP